MVRTDIAYVIQMNKPGFKYLFIAAKRFCDGIFILFFHQAEKREHVSESHDLRSHPKRKTVLRIVFCSEVIDEFFLAFLRFLVHKMKKILKAICFQVIG